MKKNKIIIFGAIREGKTPVCGETMKNQLFIKRFKELFDEVITVDTLNWKKRPWIILKIILVLLFNQKTGVVLSASGSVRYLINFIYYIPIHNIELFKYKNIQEHIICRGNHGLYYKATNFNPMEVGYKLPDINYLNKDRGELVFSDYDIKFFLNSCINTKTDRASMRYSLELRSPLMDYRLAEYSRLLPINYMMDKELGLKKILKDILYEIVPRQILERPKHGFGASVGDWFKTIMKDEFLDTVNYNSINKYIPEIKAKEFINYRDKFLNNEKSLRYTTFFKIYNYIKWIEYYG